MKKIIAALFITFLFTVKANSQITQSNWMVGGTGRFALQNEKLENLNAKSSLVEIKPNIGYFFVDKFAGGLSIYTQFSTEKYNGGKSSSSNIGVGPFLRYYFLPVDNRVNLLAQGLYTHSFLHSSGSTNDVDDFTLSAGPIFFFTENVGLELTANYELLSQKKNSVTANTFFIAAGFQIHLEREKNLQ